MLLSQAFEMVFLEQFQLKKSKKKAEKKEKQKKKHCLINGILYYIYKDLNFSVNQISNSNIRYKIIQETKTSTTSKKHTRAAVKRSFFNLVFLNFLNIRKDYYKPQ